MQMAEENPNKQKKYPLRFTQTRVYMGFAVQFAVKMHIFR